MPPQVLRIEGLDDLIRRVDQASSSFKPTMTKAMDTAVKYIHDQIPGYPSPPPGSRYVRTGELGRQLYSDVEEIGGKITGVLGNPIEYAPWVISTEEIAGVGPQASIHEGRWYTLQDKIKESMGEVFKILGEALTSLLRS